MKYRTSTKGAALIEAVVLCIVMIPLLSMLPMIGKLSDLKQTTIQASRYAAWEHTVSTSGSGPTDIKARFFEDPSIPLISGQTELGSDEAQNPLWGNIDGSGSTTADEESSDSESGSLGNSDIRISFQEGGGHSLRRNHSDSGVARTFGKGIEETGQVLDFMSNVTWDIEGDGLVEAGIQLNVVANRFLSAEALGAEGKSCAGGSDQMFSCMSTATAIMVDGWDSATNNQAEDRTRAFVPGAALEEIGRYVSYLGYIPVFKELKSLDGAFGYVDSSQLPLDRYTETYQEAR